VPSPPNIPDLSRYQLGWSDEQTPVFKAKKGLNEAVVREMSEMKGEEKWMRDFRLRALKRFEQKPMVPWFAHRMPDLDFNDIYYYVKPMEGQVESWEDLPPEIRDTYDKLGIPEAERNYLAGVSTQYDSDVVYHRNRADLERMGVLFCDMDTAVREYPELVRKWFGTIIPPNDNKFAALNSAVWSGGSFIYVPPGVKVDQPLQAYFRINTKNMGQFERTLIIADEGSQVHYLEGCSSPVYTSESLHSAVVELVALPGSRITYTTIQNWSDNVYNLVTKRARAEAEAHVEWVDGNIGCLAEGSRIVTPDGMRTIESLEVGDMCSRWTRARESWCFVGCLLRATLVKRRCARCASAVTLFS
jgi:Fe-S cluster assembly protein SufB